MRLIALFLALALPVQAQDSRLQPLQTGDDSRGFEAVGRLNMAGAGFCTATLIAPDRVLTAAHCLFDPRTGERLGVERLQFLAGWRTGRAEAIRDVTRVAIWPGFNFARGAELETVSEDFAVLALDRPVRTTGVQPFALAEGLAQTGASVAVVSYGRERAETPSIQQLCRVLDQRPRGVTVLSCAIEYGSSGSPVLIDEGGEMRIVAVISARAEGTRDPVSLGARLGGRVAALLHALEIGVSGTAPGAPQGARGSARFVRPANP